MTETLVVDPGESTGIALFVGPVLVACTTSTSPHDELRAFLRERPGARVVRESAPEVHRHNSACIEEVEAIIDQEATGLVYPVKPSQWKGHGFATLRKSDNPTNAHERDAVRLGRWFLAMRRLNALSIQPLTTTARRQEEADEEDDEAIGPPDPDLTDAHHDALREDAGHPY